MISAAAQAEVARGVGELRVDQRPQRAVDREISHASYGSVGDSDDAVPAGPLGFVERVVGGLEGGRNAEPRGPAHPALTVTGIVWSTPIGERRGAHGVTQALGQGVGVGLVESDADEQELLAAPAGDDDAVVDGATQPPGDDAQHDVADAWPNVSLTALKWSTSIMITVTTASGPWVADELVDRRFDAPAVAESGERVDVLSSFISRACRGESVLLGLGPQRPGDPCGQLGRFARLAQVVLGAELEAGGDVGAAGAGGEEEHGNGVQVGVGLHLAQGGGAVHDGHVDVEQHEIGVLGPTRLERPRPSAASTTR